MSEHEPIDSQENLVEFEHHRLNADQVKRTTKPVADVRPTGAASATTGGVITGGIKGAAMSIAKRIDGAARSARISTLPTRRKAPSFKEHALFQSMQKYRLIGDTVGLVDPFFKEHEARLGATTQMDGKTLINFGSYDYLGLNQAPSVAEAAKAAIDQYGTSVAPRA
jgi:hypothetical protein